ncbi:hypothetical protein B0H10DRAFT_2164899 [Mycena sp. CBHHK59/15]|nr:hypothetical protein B0H10DRAFT_2164899 [Mycena sp. CBHHK59/15]
MCFVDILDNLPRLRLSSSQIKMILWVMRECGAHNVPSFKALRATQKRIRDTCGIKTEPYKSDLGTGEKIEMLNQCGNLFYTNDIRALIANDFANPQVSLHIQKYPEDVAGGPVSEIWQLEKGRWCEIPLDELTPSILIGLKHYYIHEIVELIDGCWVIPALWIDFQGKTHADCHLVTRNLIRVSLQDFSLNHEELVLRNKGPLLFLDTESCQTFAKHIPNVCRAIDDGEDLFTVWMPCWADDVSGARSKQYQKHINVYAANTNLPGQLLQQEYFVRFVSTSPNASALEQLKVVMEQVKSMHVKPVSCYNADTGRPCGSRLNVPDGPADNPQQAEEASHIGHQGNYFCHICKVGGTKEEKKSPEGYRTFYEAGAPRNVEEIRSCVLEQLRLATRGVAAHVEALQTSTGTKDKIVQHWIDLLIPKSREMQTADPRRPVDEISNELLVWLGKQTDQPYNPLLDLPFFDPSQDTMLEILHTILVGQAKYTWYDLHRNWTPTQQDLFTVRLQSTNLDAAYMMQYRNGLIGKHFKTLMQTMIFHVQDIVTPGQFALLHVLKHIPQNICRRGPSVRFATEVFECFNAIFRLCSVLSNHQAPSRDIAIKFANLERVKHILSGGFWKQGTEWVSAGADVRRLLVKTSILQRHLGWAPKSEWVPGLIKASPKKKQVVLTAQQTMIPGSWVNSISITAISSDVCHIGNKFIRQNLPAFGQIQAILLPKGELSSATEGVLVIERYHISEARHFDFHMPVLVEERDKPHTIVLSGTVQFCLNVQHDCCAALMQMQERQETDRIVRTIEHKEGSCFVINTHSFHNALLLRKFLPVALTKPRPLFSDRPSRHRGLAVLLSAQQQEKRAATKAKTTRQKKKEEKEAAARRGGGGGQQVIVDESSGSDSGEENIDENSVAGRKRQRRE